MKLIIFLTLVKREYSHDRTRFSVPELLWLVVSICANKALYHFCCHGNLLISAPSTLNRM